MNTKFSSQDVKDAKFAKTYLNAPKNSGLTPEEWVKNDCPDGSMIKDAIAQYRRGVAILEHAVLMTTDDRYDITIGVGYDMAAEKLIQRGAESPVVEFTAGYVATNQMCVVAALKSK